jgi:ABC-type antimicrobial peptide transport system permease subunit
MFWKNWPSWLKGGIVGFIVFLLLSFTIGGSLMPIKSLVDLINPAEEYIGPEGIGKLGPITGINLLIAQLISLIVYILLGALIGHFIGKRKSKKQQPVQTQPQVQTK